MRRRYASLPIAALLVALICSLCGCGADMYANMGPAGEGETLADRVASGLSVRAQRGAKTLEIQRSLPSGKRPADVEQGVWTVFVYLCGSDLETEGGAATNDLGEMVGASSGDNVRFVVETGGAKRWRGKVGGKRCSRYLVQDGSIMEVDKGKAADMGDPSTLSDFLRWGLGAYPSEHMGVILWDHGGGSISGVCFDEVNNYNSLMLRELDIAFAQTISAMWQKFDFVGFDACLMSTLETANILASYANYMYASQEIEPGSGWEYSSLMEYLSRHPDCTGAELGRVLADSYMESVPRAAVATATLSVVDLSQVDGLIQDFYSFSQEMYASGEDQGTLAAMTRGIHKAENYGDNNWLEGYTNMVDLGGIVAACADVTPSAQDVLNSLDKAVLYQVRGRGHGASSGLSVYYPLRVGDSRELSAFESVVVNPSYLSYVDRLAHGATYNAGSQYTSYSSDSCYDSSGLWDLLLDEDTLSLVFGMRSAPRWEYVDKHDRKSQIVTFANKPQVNDQGVYWMQFDKAGITNVASASGLVYQQTEGSQRTLGETYDVYADWDTGIVEDGFDGKWLSLGDGQLLCLYVVASTEDEVTYTTPVLLNGEKRYVRLRQDLESGEVEVEGAWTGAGENGQVGRGSQEVAEGDEVVPLYGEDAQTSGKTFVVPAGGLTIRYGSLPEGTYRYAFNITDVFGDRLITDQVQFDVEADGIYFVA